MNNSIVPKACALERFQRWCIRAAPGLEAHLGCHTTASLKACSSTVGGYSNCGTAIARNYLVLNNIKVPRTGNYQMMVFYLLKGNRSFFISVNNGAAIELALTGKRWHEVAKASITVALKAGSNSIKFYNDHGYAPDLDR